MGLIDEMLSLASAIFASMSRFGKECDDELWSFFVDPPVGWLQIPMSGLLNGDAGDPAARIIYIGAGWDRTPC